MKNNDIKIIKDTTYPITGIQTFDLSVSFVREIYPEQKNKKNHFANQMYSKKNIQR